MYTVKIKLYQPGCSLASATQYGFSVEIVGYIILNDHTVFLCKIGKEEAKRYFEVIENISANNRVRILQVNKTPTSINFIALTGNESGIKAFEENYCFVRPPIKVKNGNKYFTVFAPDIVHLRKSYENLRRLGRWEVLELRASDSSGCFLTESQMKILKIAYEMGYFSKKRTKKRVNIQQIADATGLSKSTVHKHLRDAVCKIVGGFMKDELPDNC